MIALILSTVLFAGDIDVEPAVDWLVTTEYQNEQKRLKRRWGRHPLLRRVGGHKFMREIGKSAIVAGLQYQIDPVLLLAMAWRESHFLPEVARRQIRGKLGEQGVMQVHGKAARPCRLATVQDQMTCGARWLRIGINRCGSLVRGLNAYATGKCKQGYEIALSRIRLYNRVRRAIRGQYEPNPERFKHGPAEPVVFANTGIDRKSLERNPYRQ